MEIRLLSNWSTKMKKETTNPSIELELNEAGGITASESKDENNNDDVDLKNENTENNSSNNTTRVSKAEETSLPWYFAEGMATRVVDLNVYFCIFLASIAIGMAAGLEIPAMIAMTLIFSVVVGGPIVDGLKLLFKDTPKMNNNTNRETVVRSKSMSTFTPELELIPIKATGTPNMRPSNPQEPAQGFLSKVFQWIRPNDSSDKLPSQENIPVVLPKQSGGQVDLPVLAATNQTSTVLKNPTGSEQKDISPVSIIAQPNTQIAAIPVVLPIQSAEQGSLPGNIMPAVLAFKSQTSTAAENPNKVSDQKDTPPVSIIALPEKEIDVVVQPKSKESSFFQPMYNMIGL
jgi:hypothetical protein